MQASSKTLFKTAILLLGMLLAVSVLVAINTTDRAGATGTSDLAIVRQYVAAYIQYQYDAGNEGESGFLIAPATLKSRLGNGSSVLGEGDDAANAPVLVDNFSSSTTMIPGTTNRCFWNTGAGGTGVAQNCFDSGMLNQIRAKADAHAAAGFSTDIVVYCVSGHTEAPTTGAFGYIAQTGLLRSDGSIPRVLALKWGRNGWTNTVASYTAANPLAAAGAPSTFSAPASAPPNCNSASGNAELVRCQAQWAIYSGSIAGTTGGNVGNGQLPAGLSPNQTLSTSQIVDVRSGSPATTVKAGTTPSVSVPVDTVFDAGMLKVNPLATNGALVVSRTPMMGGIVAEGLKMLGYKTSTGGFLNGGVPKWNNTQSERQVSDGLSRPALTSAAIDAAAPTVSSLDTVAVTSTSADIHRAANEPATMKVQYGTAPGVYTQTYNHTVLNAHKTVTLTGLAPATTYYYKVTSYDGQANGTTSSEKSFSTPPLPDTEAPVVTYTGPTGTIGDSSPTITGTATDNIAVEMVSLSLNSSAPITCTVDGSGNVTCPTSGLADGDYTAEITASDAAGNSGSATGSFTVSTCTAGKPSLSLGAPSAFWASYADYTAKQLSVTWTVSNTGSTDANAVQIDSSNPTYAAITTMTAMPAVIGSVDAGLSGGTVVKYQLPVYGPGFRVVNTGSATDCAANSYTYP